MNVSQPDPLSITMITMLSVILLGLLYSFMKRRKIARQEEMNQLLERTSLGDDFGLPSAEEIREKRHVTDLEYRTRAVIRPNDDWRKLDENKRLMQRQITSPPNNL